jgi:hypothetical protein
VVLVGHRVSPRTYAGPDEGVGPLPYLVLLVVAVVVVVLVMRAAGAPPSRRGRGGIRPPRPQRPARPLAPDDDPEFLRELDRRTRRDDGSPA